MILSIWFTGDRTAHLLVIEEASSEQGPNGDQGYRGTSHCLSDAEGI